MAETAQSPGQPRPRLVVVGGTGAFGQRLVERLAALGRADVDLVIAARDGARAGSEADRISAQSPGARISGAALDARTATASHIAALGARVVINASGPFQEQDYTLARAAIAAGASYLDLADSRTFVTGITTLDAEAKTAGVLVVSGVSSVPGLSSALVAELVARFREIDTIEIAISPGNSFTPGEATMASVLASLGRPIAMRENGRTVTVYGWQGLTRGDFGSLGRRWLGWVDVPDLELLPERYPAVRSVHFRAGVEVGLFHWSLWVLSWLVRAGVLRRPERWAGPLLKLKAPFHFLGTDAGGMTVSVTGRSHADGPHETRAVLTARQGHGPYVPTLGAVALALRMARGEEPRTGAMPCLELFTRDEFLQAARGLDIEIAMPRPPP